MTSSSLEKKQARRAEIVRRLSELAPKERTDALLDEVDGRAMVRSIPAEDVYRTIVEVGLADASEVVQLSTPEQFRTYLDLAAWQKDRCDPLEVLRWLTAARNDEGDSLVPKLRALDMELVELVYKKLVEVHDLEENPDAHPEGVTFQTPEGKFLLELKAEGGDLVALQKLTLDLEEQSPFELARFIEAVRYELPTELEETAFQFRQARLQDLGFPPLDEAAKLFAFLDPAKVKVPEPRTPGLVAADAPRVDFVDAAFRGLDPSERQALEAEVRYLVNSALVAEGAEPGDPPAIRRFSEQARELLNLGLEHLCGGDPAWAPDVVRDQTLKRAFQVGFSLTLQLRRKTEALAQEPGSKFADTWLALDDEVRALAALSKRRPLKALKVPGAEPVPFRSRRELEESGALLERVRAQRAVLSELLGSSPAEVVARFGVKLADLTAQRLLAAVVARLEVGEPPGPAPFPAIRLTELCARLFDGDPGSPRLSAAAGQKALEALQGRVPGGSLVVKPMIDRVLETFRAEFGAKWLKDLKVDAKNLMSLPVEGELPL